MPWIGLNQILRSRDPRFDELIRFNRKRQDGRRAERGKEENSARGKIFRVYGLAAAKRRPYEKDARAENFFGTSNFAAAKRRPDESDAAREARVNFFFDI